MNENEGKWVTIKGRHIFLKDGQSVSDAINEYESKKDTLDDIKGITETNHEDGDLTFEMSDEDKKKYDEVGKKMDKLTEEIGNMVDEEEEYNLYKMSRENPDEINSMTEWSTDWESLDEKYSNRYENEKNEKYSTDYWKSKNVDMYDSAPDGWSKLEGATTAPRGYAWYSNNKSRFGGEYEHALVKEDENKTNNGLDKYYTE